MSHHLFSMVGGVAVVLTVALWLMPALRGTLAAKLMPVISAAVQAGPARLLQGHPLPAFGPPARASSDDSLAANSNGTDAASGTTAVNGNTGVIAGNTGFDGAFDATGSTGVRRHGRRGAERARPAHHAKRRPRWRG